MTEVNVLNPENKTNRAQERYVLVTLANVLISVIKNRFLICLSALLSGIFQLGDGKV